MPNRYIFFLVSVQSATVAPDTTKSHSCPSLQFALGSLGEALLEGCYFASRFILSCLFFLIPLYNMDTTTTFDNAADLDEQAAYQRTLMAALRARFPSSAEAVPSLQPDDRVGRGGRRRMPQECADRLAAEGLQPRRSQGSGSNCAEKTAPCGVSRARLCPQNIARSSRACCLCLHRRAQASTRREAD